MSWDFWLEIDTGGPEPARLPDLDLNYTYNVSPMYRAALPSTRPNIRDLDDTPCNEATRILTETLLKMRREPERYKAMEPENGWGTYEGAMKVLEQIILACQRHPKATLRVS